MSSEVAPVNRSAPLPSKLEDNFLPQPLHPEMPWEDKPLARFQQAMTSTLLCTLRTILLSLLITGLTPMIPLRLLQPMKLLKSGFKGIKI